MNDLADLMRQTADEPGSDDLDVGAVVRAGRRRARSRRRRIAGGVATLAAAAVVGTVTLTAGVEGPKPADRRRTPPAEGPVLRLDSARPAVEGVDYGLLTTHVVPDLETEPSTHVAGVTEDDKLVLAQTNISSPARVTLVDPVTGARDELPRALVSEPIELGEERLVFTTLGRGERPRTRAEVFDRTTRTWSRISWVGLPTANARLTDPIGIGPDDRVYLSIRREFEPAAPELWSVSLTDPTDVRDESLPADRVDLTDGVLTWTDSDDAPTGTLHVRDLATGEQTDLEVPGGDVCDTSVDRRGGLIALSQRCGVDDAPDDRVVVLDAEGEPLVTIAGITQGNAWVAGSTVVVQSSAADAARGTYVYDSGTGDLVLLDEEAPLWGSLDPTPGDVLLWSTNSGDPNDYSGTFHLARWRD
jgi:hypothetical protein